MSDIIDKKYIKVTPREHVLLKPSMYLGDTTIRKEENYVIQNNNEDIIFIKKKEINWSPAFYKIFDEIIVNVYDQTIRDKTLNRIDIKLDSKFIEVSNDGIGIDIAVHPTHKIYIPELIFGNLLSSTNFSSEDNRITGGTHGLGAKLTNIFSKKFVITVKDVKRKLIYTQVFKNNLSIIEKPVVTKASNLDNGGLSVKYYPDFKRFDMEEIDQDHMMLFTKRVYDLAGLTGKKIYLNGKKIVIKSWKEYIKLYDNDIVHYKCNEHWELGLKLEHDAYQVSFVNGIFTNRNGKHVEYILDQIYDKLVKKNTDITKRWIKNTFTLILKTSIVNPSFNSQTKEELMTSYGKMGIICDLDSKFFKLIDMDKLKQMLQSTTIDSLKKTDGSKKSKIKGIPKLEDANYAGTKKSTDCTLILTEGDSAKAMAISGMSAIKNGRDYYGVFPLKGKLLNVRDETATKINANEEITNIKKILGLKGGITYTKDNIGLLRYGSVMLMMDADEDGSHIKALFINFINVMFPSLLDIKDFLKIMVTPVVKITNSKTNRTQSFISLSEYNKWKKTNNVDGYKIKYYKGLGTSTSKEAVEYFTDLSGHSYFVMNKTETSSLELAFSKNFISERKKWLEKYDPTKILTFKPQEVVDIKDVINLELKHFSHYSLVRAIPGLMDGFKPSQRKIFFGCLKRNLYSELKVAQLGSYVAEVSAYHHGEKSLSDAIVKMAQDFVGSNNINLLLPIGQFGTRLAGGKDSSSPRYIFTRLNDIVKFIFRKEDTGILEHNIDDGNNIEPISYYPIIPTILVNGAEGMGTGYSTFIPSYNPVDIIKVLKNKLNGQKNKGDIVPYYNGFTGQIMKLNDNSYVSKGIYKIDGTAITITELPIKTWTSTYKEYLEDLIYNSDQKMFTSYKNLSSEKEVKFILKIADVKMISSMIANQVRPFINEFEEKLKLYSYVNESNMTLYFNNEIKQYNTPMEIINDFYKTRLELYEKRRLLLLELLKIDLDIQNNLLKWLKLILDGKINLRVMTIDDLTNYLIKNSFSKNNNSYDYLLNLTIKEMSKDSYEKLINKIKKIKEHIDQLNATNKKEMWLNDLVLLEKQLG